MQEQEQCTSLAVLERRLVTKVGTSTQHRYQNVLKEETLRHQVNAQSIRVQALKESWEQMFELSARKSSDELLKEWQARLRKELAAFDAHKVQNELLRVRTASPRSHAALSDVCSLRSSDLSGATKRSSRSRARRQRSWWRR